MILCSFCGEHTDPERSLFKSPRWVWHVWARLSQHDDIVVIQMGAVYETMRSRHRQPERAMLLQCQPTLPSGLADARLPLAATSVGVAAASQAEGYVAGFPLPVGFAVTVHRTSGVPHATLAAVGAVVGTCIHPGKEERG